MIASYIKKIAAITKRGDATEPSYYAALKEFLETFSDKQRHKKIVVTILPKKTEAGNPDFRVWDGKHSQVGYIEAKTPKTNLDDIEDSEQLNRYKETFPNLILTNFYEFRLFRYGQLVAKVLVARPFIAAKLKAIPPVEHEPEFNALLEKFFQFSLPTKFTAESLAKELATRTRFLRDQVITAELQDITSEGGQKLHGFYETFQKYLIANLKPDEFADLYAQTLTYGLFAARTRANGEFNRKIAYDLIPKSIGILREIFHFVSFDPPEQLAATVDDIAEVLGVADVNAIMHEYYADRHGSDPIYHFYETFLAEYDPQLREKRGVYYTPEPVVSYIVRSLNILLKEKFNRPDGLATPKVTVLDPAAGTLTFLAEAARLAVKEYADKYGKGSQKSFIEDHILKDFYAFELMMAPYAAGHLKMGFLLEELGHKLVGDERFQFYLTNTLEMDVLEQTSLPGMSSLSHESKEAHKVKNETPILVVLGNPPYSGHSSNKGQWITNQINSYKIIDGQPLKEKNPKWLQDDYVKFIRFAQWKIEQLGEGIIGFITNHSYLDNPTFRGMRQSLLNSFDEIYILDLHGNSLKKEKCPDGSKDENVFDIQQGVSIAIFIKSLSPSSPNPLSPGEREATVFHADFWGLREYKYSFLRDKSVSTTKWRELKPSSPAYFLVPRNETLLKQYNSYMSVPEIFPINSVGFYTARDHLTIHWASNELWNNIRHFVSLEPEDARAAYKLGRDMSDWKVESAQEDLIKSGMQRNQIIPALYRPFDKRFTYYTGHSGGFHCRPRSNFMRHMLEENLAMCIGRAGQVVGLEKDWNLAFCSDTIIDLNIFYRGGSANFPLYLYPASDKHDLFSGQISGARVPNISGKVLGSNRPESIFYYIYAVLYSNAYRQKYAEFLKSDFPRIPFTSNKKVFHALAKKGEELVNLHLLKSKALDKPIARFDGDDSNRVEKLSYEANTGRVWINPKQYFRGVKFEVWNYHIGGYQVAEKWLKDRKNRRLTSDEVSHYCRIIASLAKTIEIQKSLDTLFEQAELEILNI